MLPPQRRQVSFLMATTPEQMVPADHPLMQVREKIDFSFVREETQDLYSAAHGRPAYPPEQLFKILLLELWMNLSDVQVCQQLHYNLLYRAFCGIGWNDPVPDDSTLVRFRARLGAERFHRLFQRLMGQLKEQGLLSNEWAIADGTKVAADVAVRNTLQLVREGRRRIIRELKKSDPERAAELESLAEPLEDGKFTDRSQLLAAEMARGRELLERLPQEGPGEMARLKRVYRAILEGDGTASLDDPDARWGFKKADEPYLGYKAHVLSDEQGFVTAFTVTPAADAEQKQVGHLLQQAEALGIRSRKFAGDKAYDTQPVRHLLKERGINAFIGRRNPPRIPEGFRLKTPQQLQCPQGHVARATRHTRSTGIQFTFSQKLCQRCPLREGCLPANETRKRLYYNHERARQPLGMKKAMKVRAGIERIFGGVKKWHGYGRARYRARDKVVIQTALTFTVWNLKKAVKAWAS